ncbi:MAG: phospholipase D-like domain-containing protein [Acidobacteriota bacterium]
MAIRNTPIEPGQSVPNITELQIEEAQRRERPKSRLKVPGKTLEDGLREVIESADFPEGRRLRLPNRRPPRDPEAAESRRRAESNAPTGPKLSPNRKRLLLVPFVLFLLLLAVGLYQTNKPMPLGTSVASEPAPARVELLLDLTYDDAAGSKVHDQQIFDRLFRLIDEAQGFLLLDMFLFNDFAASGEPLRPLSGELTEALLVKRREQPAMPVVFVTDPLNTVYGGRETEHLERLQDAGVDVVFTRLEELRDSNPLYSSFWRIFLAWTGNDPEAETLPNPFDPEDKLSLRSYFHLLNFKANHRKVAVTLARDGTPRALVSSANPHDGSAAHSNIAFVVDGPAAYALAESELNVARFSGLRSAGDLLQRLREVPNEGALPAAPLAEPVEAAGEETAAAGDEIEAPGEPSDLVEAQLLTEGAIGRALVADLDSLGPGDAVAGTLFYLSWRPVIEALIGAAERGASVRLILDPNRDAFGREKSGVPNRPVAHELTVRSEGAIEVRWYATQGEQFHSKALLLRRGQELLVHGGSANLTRRNVGDLNMEANVRLRIPAGAEPGNRLLQTFQRLWANRDGRFTLDYSEFEDREVSSYWKYRFGEATGLSTF